MNILQHINIAPMISGALLILGLHYLHLFIRRRKNSEYVLIALFAFIASLVPLLPVNSSVLPSLWLLERTILLSSIGLALVFLFFQKNFTKRKARIVYLGVIISCIAAISFALMFPTIPSFPWEILAKSFVVISIILCYYFTLYSLVVKKSGWLVLIALLLLSISLLLGQYLSPLFTSIGLLVFTFIFSMSLSHQFTSSIDKVQSLAESLDEKVKERTLALVKSTRAKSQFLASMSHEIRTPLNSILGTIDLLSESKLSDKQNVYIEVLERAGKSLLTQINDILDFSKLEAGGFKLENIVFSPKESFENVQTLMSLRAVKKNLILQSSIDDSIPEYVYGDPSRIEQILINLVGNAIKFTEKGYILLAINSTIIDNETVSLQFSVSDTGMGIPKNKQPQIFEVFSQVDSSTSRLFGGSGLGLTISKSLIELMKGKIWVESITGVGSTFYFELPLKKAKKNKPEKVPTTLSTEESLAGLSVLLVEDNDDNVFLMDNYLKKTGMLIEYAPNGLIAIEKFKENNNQFDLILMDVQMPIMDGYQATRQIRKIEKEQAIHPTTILALTANATIEDIEKSKSAGCNDHRSKPIKKKDLLNWMQQNIDSIRKRGSS